MAKKFFEEMTDQSYVKKELVTKYFHVWASIMDNNARDDRLLYIDLFSGPGRYENNKKSTPLLVLEHIISKPSLCKKMVTLFNDANADYVNSLSAEIDQLEGIEKLKHKPTLYNTVVGDEIADHFEKINLIPTFAFVDPWGYKGLSSRLIWSLIKDWGSDCIFFFNYNRINMGITNLAIAKHINAIFGEERADKLRKTLGNLSPEEKELTILNELSESLSNNRNNYVLPFKFIRGDKERTSHYLIFVSKHQLGYTIMKNLMSKASSDQEDGVASFSYVNTNNKQLSLLFQYSRPLDELGDELLSQFSGRTLTTKMIHDSHHIGTRFVLNNYKEALRRLEKQGKIATNPPANKRRTVKGVKTFADSTKVTFP